MNQFESFLDGIAVGGTAWVGAKRLGMDADMFHTFAIDSLQNGRQGFVFGEPKRESSSGKRHIVMFKVTREE
ncbi:MAG: hypothetical protein ACK4NM_07630 [Hydrogenophaga sp.]